MSTKQDGGQAFPSEFFETEHGDRVSAFAGSPGMTLRDWFAGQAIKSPVLLEMRRSVREHDLAKWFGGRTGITEAEIFTALAFQLAGDMLKARAT